MARLLMTIMGRPAICDLQYYLKARSLLFVRNKTYPVVFKLSDTHRFTLYQQHFYSTKPKDKDLSVQQQSQSSVSEDVKPITFKTVKETTKTASYLGVILLGVGVTGIIFYTVFSELFSSNSPNSVYSKALDTVCNDTRVQDALGTPLNGYGEENRRGRRQHVSHLKYEKDGEKRLRMKFYISGSRKRATVHLEMKEDKSGNYIYRYLFVELDDFGRHPIVIEDNRFEKTGLPVKIDQTLEELDLSSPLNINLNFPDAGLK